MYDNMYNVYTYKHIAHSIIRIGKFMYVMCYLKPLPLANVLHCVCLYLHVFSISVALLFSVEKC